MGAGVDVADSPSVIRPLVCSRFASGLLRAERYGLLRAVLGAFWKHSRRIQGAFYEHSKRILEAF